LDRIDSDVGGEWASGSTATIVDERPARRRAALPRRRQRAWTTEKKSFTLKTKRKELYTAS